MKQFFYIVLLTTLGVFSTTGCKNKLAEPPGQSVADIIAGNSDYSILNAALVRTGYNTLLSTSPSVTVFAPNDAAFIAAGITATYVDTVTLTTLQDIIGYHLVGETVTAAKIVAQSRLETLYGKYLYTSNTTLDGARVNGQLIQSEYTAAANGIIHPVSTVFTPITKTIQNYLEGDTTLSLFTHVIAKDTVTIFANNDYLYTVFAPVNSAFRARGITTTTIDAMTQAQLDTIIWHHYLSSITLQTTDFVNNTTFTTVSDSILIVHTRENTNYGLSVLARNMPDTVKCSFVSKDSLASNGIFHKVDQMMTPQ